MKLNCNLKFNLNAIIKTLTQEEIELKAIIEDILSEDDDRQADAFLQLRKEFFKHDTFIPNNVNILLYYCFLFGIGSEKDLRYIETMIIINDIPGASPNYFVQTAIGKALFYGKDIKKNVIEALNYLNVASKNNIAEAQYFYSILLSKGDGVQKDEKTALALLIKAAVQGYPEASNDLGLKYAQANGVFKNDTRACELFLIASQYDHPRACFNLGWMYKFGLGVSKDPQQALVLFKKALTLGEEDAQKEIDKLTNQIEKKTQSDLSLNNQVGAVKGLGYSFKMLSNGFPVYSSLQGDGDDEIKLQQDVQKASVPTSQSSNSVSQTNVHSKPMQIEAKISKEKPVRISPGDRQFLGDFIENLTKEDEELKLAIKNILSENANKQYAAFLSLQQIVLSQKSPLFLNAVFLLAYCYHFGVGIKQDISKALNLLSQLKHKNYFVLNELGRIYAELKNYVKALEFFEKAASQNCADALYNMGMLYKTGLFHAKFNKLAQGSGKDFPDKIWGEAAALGHPEARLELIHKSATENQVDSSFWLWAAEQGFLEAQLVLAEANAAAAQEENDRAKGQAALSWYEKASKHEVWIQHKIWPLKDHNKAFYLAEYEIGRMYILGRGISEDNKIGVYWIKKAARRGDTQAQDYLKSVGIDYLTLEGSESSVSSPSNNGSSTTTSLSASNSTEKTVQQPNNASPVASTGKSLGSIIATVRQEQDNPSGVRENKTKEESAATTGQVLVKERKVNEVDIPTISQETVEFIKALQATGLQPQELVLLKQQLQEVKLSAEEAQMSLDWAKKLHSQTSQLDTLIEDANRNLGKNSQARREQEYVDSKKNLKIFKDRVEREFSCFAICYFLAPAGIFALAGNKKDAVISAVGNIPIAGQFLKIFTAALSYANKKHRFYQMNRLNDLFLNLVHITEISCDFARKLALAKEQEIDQHVEVVYKGAAQIKGFLIFVKDSIKQQWEGLSTRDKTGVKFWPEDKLAVFDVAFTLQQVISGVAKIDGTKDLVAQFVEIVTGEPYKPRVFTAAITPTSTDSQPKARPDLKVVKDENKDNGENKGKIESKEQVPSSSSRGRTLTQSSLSLTNTTPSSSLNKKGMSNEDLFALLEQNTRQLEELKKEHEIKQREMEQLKRKAEELSTRNRQHSEFAHEMKRKMDDLGISSVSGGSQAMAQMNPLSGRGNASQNVEATLQQFNQRLLRAEAGLESLEDRAGNASIKPPPAVETEEEKAVRRKLFE